MPLVKIEIEKGYSREFLESLFKLTMDCVQTALHLLPDDRNIRLIEYEKGFFTMKPPYRIIVEVSLFAGRSVDAKRNLYKLLTTTLQEQLKIGNEEVFILLNEQPKENWGIRGGVAACDIDLGFKVNV